MADYAYEGTSGAEVLDLQAKMNQLLGSGSVKETGDFDKQTVARLKSIQQTLGLPATGRADDKTMEAIKDGIAQRGWHIVTYKGKKYQLTEAEFQAFDKKVRAEAVKALQPFVQLADEAQRLWDAHNTARNNNCMAVIVEKWSRATFPKAGVISAGTRAASEMVKAAKNGVPVDVKAKSEPIKTALKAISDFRNKIYDGGEDLIGKLEVVRDSCVAILEVSAAVATAGGTATLQVGAAAGLGAYKGLLSGVSNKSVAKVTVKNVGGAMFKQAAIDGTIGYIMKGNAKGFENMADELAESAVKKYASGARGPLKAYMINAFNGGVKSTMEQSLNNIATNMTSDQKLTEKQMKDKLLEAFVKGAFLTTVGTAAEKYAKNNAGKNFKGEEFFTKNKHKKADPAQAYAEGLKGVVDKAGLPATQKALESLSPKKASKAEDEIKMCVIGDPKVVAWVKAYEKKQK